MQLTELCSLLSASSTAREARSARRRVRDRALQAAQSTVQREALQRRRERGFCAEFTYVYTYVCVHIHLYGRIYAAMTSANSLRLASQFLHFSSLSIPCSIQPQSQSSNLRDDTVVGGQRRGKFGKFSHSGRVTSKLSTCITVIDDSCKTGSAYTGRVVNGRIARAAS